MVFLLDIEWSRVMFSALSSGPVFNYRPSQLCAIRARAETLVSSGLADKIIAEKLHERNDAWFEEASVCTCPL